MKFTKQAKSFCATVLVTFLLAIPVSYGQRGTAQATTNTTVPGTSAIWGILNNISVTGLVEGPATAESPLQIVCVFEYTENDIYNSPPALPVAVNGLVHLDQALHGKFTEIRKNNFFSGKIYETFLLIPPQGVIKSEKLLLIGLGDRSGFSPEIMVEVGKVATREALKLGVTSFSIASDLKDAGIDSPTALVAGNIVKGMIREYRKQEYLKENNLVSFQPLSQVYLLAGPAFFQIAGEGIQDAISSLEKETDRNMKY